MSPIARDAEAERLLHGAVRQVPRSAGVGDQSRSGRSTPGPPAAAASSTSTASSAARRTSGTPRSTRAPRPIEAEEDARRGLPLHGGHDRQGHRPGSASRRRSSPTSRSSSTSRPARPTRRTTCPRNGPTSTRASSTRAGTSCAKRPSPGRRSWASSRRTASSPRATRRSRRGTTCRRRSSPCCAAQMEVYAGFLEYTDHHVGRLLDTLEEARHLSTTRWSTTSSATTARRPKAR